MNKIEENLLESLKKFNLIEKRFVVGFSGGSDSTALIIALKQIQRIVPNLYFEAFHVNYGIREESNKDEKFVQYICSKLEIKLIIKNVKNENINLQGDSENELRKIRYQLISKYIINSEAYCLLTAHNLNDHVETFLMKLARGTGLKGMEGINNYSILEEFEGLKIYRPLIKIKKEDLLEYCLINNENPIYDVTNNNIKFSRNRIRKKVIPEFEKLNPGFLNTVNRLTMLVKELNGYQNKLVDKIFKEIKINENSIKISFKRIEFNLLESFEKKLIIKSKCESISHSVFIESKHIDIIIAMCNSKNNSFSLDLPGPIIINATKGEVSLEKLISK
tara:strand:- start:862 stop:1863 length:1002 start_codon:yes stop_codon:yes gene_type:complete